MCGGGVVQSSAPIRYAIVDGMDVCERPPDLSVRGSADDANFALLECQPHGRPNLPAQATNVTEAKPDNGFHQEEEHKAGVACSSLPLTT
jgi:hypothetical protein